MCTVIALRTDFDGLTLRRPARKTRDANQRWRLLAVAEIYDGGRRSDAARIGGEALQIVRDREVRFNAEGPDGLLDCKPLGHPPKPTAAHKRALSRMTENAVQYLQSTAWCAGAWSTR